MTIYAIRAIAFVLSILYTFTALSTCSSYQPGNSNSMPVQSVEADLPKEQAPDKLVLSILHPQGEIGYQLLQAAELFSTTHSNIEIRIHGLDGKGEYLPMLKSKLLSGEQVDLFHIYGYQDYLELEDYLLDLSSLPWAGQAIPGTLDAVTVDQAIYGIPYSVEGYGLIANRNIFEVAGIPLSGLATFEDLEETYQELRSQIDSGELFDSFPSLRYVTEFPALDNHFLGEQVANLILSDSFSSSKQAAESRLLSINNDEQVERYVRLSARYSSSRADWEGLNQVAVNTQVEGGLASGRVALIQQSTQIHSRMTKAAPDLENRLALLPIPLGEEDNGIYVGASSYWAVNSNSSQDSINLALEFLTWLYQSDTGNRILSDSFGVLSPYHDLSQQTDVSLYNQLLQYIIQGQTKPIYTAEVPTQWNEAFSQSIRDYFSSDDLSWNKVLQDSAALWRERRKTG